MKYLIKIGNSQPWREVSYDEYQECERGAGFDRPTGGFGGAGVQGRQVHSIEYYDWSESVVLMTPLKPFYRESTHARRLGSFFNHDGRRDTPAQREQDKRTTRWCIANHRKAIAKYEAGALRVEGTDVEQLISDLRFIVERMQYNMDNNVDRY